MESPLTAREQQVALEVISGYTTSQIAARLGVDKKTVEVHRYNVYKKLNVHSARELMLRAVQSRWVLPRCIPHLQRDQITKLTHRSAVSPQLVETLLTQRQLQVFLGIIQGLSVSEIAQRLGIEEKTAMTHVSKVHKKLGLSRELAITLFALRVGLLPGMEEFREKRRLTASEFVAILPER